MIENFIGDRTPGRMDRMRIQLELSVDEFSEFIENQRKAHADLIEAEEKLRLAREAFVQSCTIKKPVAELPLSAKGDEP